MLYTYVVNRTVTRSKGRVKKEGTLCIVCSPAKPTSAVGNNEQDMRLHCGLGYKRVSKSPPNNLKVGLGLTGLGTMRSS